MRAKPERWFPLARATLLKDDYPAERRRAKQCQETSRADPGVHTSQLLGHLLSGWAFDAPSGNRVTCKGHLNICKISNGLLFVWDTPVVNCFAAL